MKLSNLVKMLLAASIDAQPRLRHRMIRAAPQTTFVSSVGSPSWVAQHDNIDSRLAQLNQADREAVELLMQEYYFPRVARKFGPAVVYG